MTTALVTFVLVAALVWALDRNHHGTVRLAGSTDVEDRDSARLAAELRAAQRPVTRHRAAAPAGQVTARKAATVRPASVLR